MSDRSTKGRSREGRPIYLGLRRSEWAIGATCVALNAVTNHRLTRRWHVPGSLAAAAIVSGLALRAGAGTKAQGLSARDLPGGILAGVAASLPIAAVITAGVVVGPSRGAYRERRIVDATAREAAYEVLFRIPVTTALPEEIIFRGALLGLLNRYHQRLLATTVTSVLFGLWHIAPTVDRLKTNELVNQRPAVLKVAWVMGSVVFTAAAGAPLAWLRYRSGSVVAPWMVHCAANASGFTAAWLAGRALNAKP